MQAQIHAFGQVLSVYPDEYTHTRSQPFYCKGKVLGSRLSRPGSPLAALSQLRSTERGRVGGMGDRGGEDGRGEKEMEKSSRGHLSQCATCELLFSSLLCDPRIVLHD